MRLFTAIRLPEAAIQHLDAVIDQLERADWEAHHFHRVRWVARENRHLTLKFLGEVDDPRLVVLREQLGRIRVPALTLRATELITFPKRRPAHVIAAKVAGDEEALRSIVDMVEVASDRIEVPRERRGLVPHVTFGRSRDGARIGDHVAAAAPFPGPSFIVSSFELIKSTLTPSGSVYETLATYG